MSTTRLRSLGRLVLERPDVDPAAEHAAKRLAPLVKLRHAAHAGHRVEIARIDRRAAGQQGVRERRPAVVGQRAQAADRSRRAGRAMRGIVCDRRAGAHVQPADEPL